MNDTVLEMDEMLYERKKNTSVHTKHGCYTVPMQDHFENHQYVKISIEFPMYKILYNGYTIGYTL